MPRWNPTAEQTKTLLRENFTANSKLDEYVEPKQNLNGKNGGGADGTRHSRRRIEGKFDESWQLRDSFKKNNDLISDTYSEFATDYAESRPTTQMNQTLNKKHSRVVFTEKDVLRSSQ